MAIRRHNCLDFLKGLSAVSPLALLLAIRCPRQLPVFLADVVRAYRSRAQLRAPAAMPAELLDFRGVIQLRMGDYGIYPDSGTRLVLCQLVAMLRPERVFEIGTYVGRSTAEVAMNVPEGGQVFTLDLPPASGVPSAATDLHLVELSQKEVGSAFRGTPWYGTKIVQLYGDSKTFDFSPYYDSIDLVIIDGSHSHEYVFNDSMHAFRMVRPGGILLWHDYESMRSQYGVTKFVDILRLRHGCPIYRLSSHWEDSRYAVMRVDAETKSRLDHILRDSDSYFRSWRRTP